MDRQVWFDRSERALGLSIVMPVLNEARTLADALRSLQPLRARGTQVIVVDGGSSDGSVDVARPLADVVLPSSRGRAVQMNAGAHAAKGDVLLFLHVDTRPPVDADLLLLKALARSHRSWGRFDVRLTSRRPLLRLVESLMNLRSRLTGIATGDQAIFVRRATFEKLGGFPPIALMEDVVFSARLKRESRPLCLRARVTVSSRKWEREGVIRTILLMWRLRLAFFLGAEADELARRYYRGDRQHS